MWTIKIDYGTGSSFHNEDIEGEEVGYCWVDVERAKEALAYIKELDEYVELTEGRYWGNLTESQRQKRAKHFEKRPWFNEEYPTYCFHAVGNDGEKIQINAFWVGYFESLHAARVVPVSGTDGMTYDKRGW